MAAPFTFADGTATSGTSSDSFAVTAPTNAGDALAVIIGVGGSSTPGVVSVTDTKGNTYSEAAFITGAAPQLWVYTATGTTTALGTSDHVTVTLTGATTGGWAVTGTDLPGVAVTDASEVASGSGSGGASVSGTPALAQETALAAFAWANSGGTGSLAGPFTQLAQLHAGSGIYLTSGYGLNPAAGSLLTASDAMASAGWRAILLTFEPSASPDLPQINPGPTWLGLFKPGLPRPRPPVPPFVSPPPPVLLSGTLAMPGMALAGTARELQPSFDPVAVLPGPTWTALFKPGQPKPKPPVPPLPLPQAQGAVALGTAFQDIPEIRPGPTWLAQFKPGMPKPRSYPPESRILPLVLLHGSLAMSRMTLSGTAAVDTTPGANSPRQVWRTPDKVHRSGAVMQ